MQQGLSFSILQIKERKAIDMQHDESLGEPNPVGRSQARERRRETKRAWRCQPQISQATQRLLAFNAHCLPLFMGERGTRWSVLKERGGQAPDDSLGAEFKNIKLETCALK